MEVGENDNQSSGDPVFDLLMEQSGSDQGSTEQETQVETPQTETETAPEPEGETPEGLEGSTSMESHQEQTPTQEPQAEQTDTSEEYLDPDTWIGEMSNGMFKTIEEFQQAEVFDRVSQYDQLVEELEQYRNAQPEYANDFTKELDEYVRGGGDPKAFFEIVTANYDEVSDIDLMTKDLMSKQGLTSEEAQNFINYRYKLDTEEFTDKEAEMGKLNMKMDANKVREEFKALQEKARIPEASRNLEDFEQSESQRMEQWDERITDTVSKMEDPIISLGEGLGDFKYQLSAQDRDTIDDFVFNAIEGFGLDINETDPQIIATMAENHVWATRGKEIVRAALAEQKSKFEEQSFKERHNPSPIPETEVAGGEQTMSRDEQILNTILGAEGRM